MEISIVALIIMAFPVCVVTLNYILVSRQKGLRYAIRFSYFVLTILTLFFIGGSIAVIRAFIIGDITNIGRPGNMLLIAATTLLLLVLFGIYRFKKINVKYSKSIYFFLIGYTSLIILWGIISYIAA